MRIAKTASIRVARESDANDVATLTGQLGYDVSPAAARQRLSRILRRADQQFFIAEFDGRTVGWLHALIAEYVEAEPFVVLGRLVIDRTHRGKGIGTQLLEQAEKWARKQGCAVVRLWSTSTRAAAHQFYEQLGYTNVKTQYAFAKSVDPARHVELAQFVPRVES
jgi:GNAT superfamily N-acetyltransferase